MEALKHNNKSKYVLQQAAQYFFLNNKYKQFNSSTEKVKQVISAQGKQIKRTQGSS